MQGIFVIDSTIYMCSVYILFLSKIILSYLDLKNRLNESYLSILPQYLPSAEPPGCPDGTGDIEVAQHVRRVTR